jgi:hypothetical protein
MILIEALWIAAGQLERYGHRVQNLMPRIVTEQEPDAHVSSARRADYAAAA